MPSAIKYLAFLCAAFLLATLSNPVVAQSGDDIRYDTPSFGGFVGADHWDVDKQYDQDGETREFFGTSMEWSLRIRAGGWYRVADSEIGGRPTSFKGEAGLSYLARKFKQDENSNADDLSASSIENIYFGVKGVSRLNDRARIGIGFRYYHDLVGSDNDVNLSDEQNAIVPSLRFNYTINDKLDLDLGWKCAYTLEGKYDFTGSKKTNGDLDNTFDMGNYQNFNVGGSYTVVQNDSYSLDIGASLNTILRSNSKFGGNEFDNSSGRLVSIGPSFKLKTERGLTVRFRGQQDEYGLQSSLLSVNGKNFNKSSKDFGVDVILKY
ncbi:MAG: hypothetical protein HKN43_00250 [Rhodothermales bacterium]|nr:hypothetical protein [Rhodothermales bacterium]